MGADIRPSDVDRTAVDQAAVRDAAAAAATGDRVRPIIELRRKGGRVTAFFAPRRLGPLDPLFAVDGFSMALSSTPTSPAAWSSSSTTRTSSRSPTPCSPTCSPSPADPPARR